MLSIDPTRLDLASEYKANPKGPHSPDLQRVLKLLSNPPAINRYIAAQPARNGPWYLALTTGPKNTPVQIFNQQAFATEDEANWAVFRKRWALASGQWLQLDDDDCGDPSLSGSIPSTNLAQRPLLGYANEISVHSGQQIDFKVSATQSGHYQAKLIRIRSGDHDHLGRKELPVRSAIDGTYPARVQPISAGSFIAVPTSQRFATISFALQMWIWPTSINKGRQALAGTWNDTARTGYGLMLDASGAAQLLIGNGQDEVSISVETPMRERCWYLLAASFDSASGELWVAQRPIANYARDSTSATAHRKSHMQPTANETFRLAAWLEENAVAGGHYNGKIEAPMLWARPLTQSERDAISQHGEAATDPGERLAAWDFSVGISTVDIHDSTENAHHGLAVNLPTRAVKGRLWNGDDYRWLDNSAHYAAIHFHDDDLYDCDWQTDFSLTIDTGLASGLYAVHLEHHDSEDWIPFVVRPPTGSATARLALILPTASYWAYANRHGVITYPGREHVKGAFANINSTDLFLHHHPELGLSMYDEHSDGSGVCYSSRLRPVVSLRPGEALWQLPADSHIIDWLDEKAISYDVITEDDLDAHGYELLAPYQCVMTGTHPEYPSKPMMDAYLTYQQHGGRFMYLGGNGFYWRVSYHPELPGVIEMRRAEDGIRAWMAEGGEYYHASTGELGGMWRRMGQAPQSIAGTGMTAQGFDFSCGYARTEASNDPRVRFIFDGVEKDETIGDFGLIGGGAAGWEIDRADFELGTPPHALIVAQATQFSANYHSMKEELHHTHAAITGETSPQVRCDMVFYETPNGGAVFSTSSIAWAGSLSHNHYDNNVSRITQNVIERFIDAAPFS